MRHRVWPPAGIALAAILLLGCRAWPAIFAGAFIVNLTTAGDIATSVAIATGNTVEAIAGAWLVNRFAGGKNVFDRPQGVFKFALTTAIGAAMPYALCSAWPVLRWTAFADWRNYGAIWVIWWLGDVTGDLLFTPLVPLATKERRRTGKSHQRPFLGDVSEHLISPLSWTTSKPLSNGRSARRDACVGGSTTASLFH